MSLRKRTVKLALLKPELRKDLLPLLVEASSKPAVFLDFDETLAHSVYGNLDQQIAAAQKKVEMMQRLHDRLSSPKTQRLLDEADEALERLTSSKVPIVSFSDGETLVVYPRPGLTRFLTTLKSFATLYILSFGSPEYLARAVPALDIGGFFKGVFSMKGGQSPPNLSDPWVLVDDLGPGTSGTKSKLRALGDLDPNRVVQIKPYTGGNDNALMGIVSEIRDRLTTG